MLLAGDNTGIARYGLEEGGGGGWWRRNVPLPFDHFFFCFLPADAAAGACFVSQDGDFPVLFAAVLTIVAFVERCCRR
jgi:hypothetical protein